MHVVERDLTDEEYDSIYKETYPDPWTPELLKTCKEYLNNGNQTLGCDVPKYVKEVNDAEWIHFKNAIRYWEKKLNL